MSDNPRALAQRARAAADILDAAADDGRPMPSTVQLYPRADVVDIRFDDPAHVYLWAQWRGIADCDVRVREHDHNPGSYTVSWSGEIYDQPVEVWAIRRLPETNPWDTPVRDEVPA